VSLLDDIPEASLVALDSVVWIYEVEAYPSFGPVVPAFFRDRLDAGRNRTSWIGIASSSFRAEIFLCGRSRKLSSNRRPRCVQGAASRCWMPFRSRVRWRTEPTYSSRTIPACDE
jgi:hypothetical protein